MLQRPPRYDFKKRGERFVLQLGTLLAILAVIYVTLHIAYKPTYETNLPKKEDIFKFLAATNDDRYGNGVLLINDESNALYFLGRETIELFREKTYTRNDEIERLVSGTQVSLIRSLGLLQQMVGPTIYDDGEPILNALMDCLDAGQYTKSARIWRTVIRQLSPTSLAELETLPESMLANLLRLNQLKREQRQAYDGLAIPRLARIFWVTGSLALMEVIFWSVFGVVTNLLINSAKFLTQGNFRPVEIYVGFTKLIYGPMISIVMVLAILIGWIDVGSYETVSWSLPVLGFIFGYNSRKTAALIDRISERILGAAQKSIDEGPSAVTKRRLEYLRGLLRTSEPATTFKKLMNDAQAVSDELVTAIVTEKEKGS